MKKWVMFVVVSMLMAACNEPDELEPEKTETLPPIEWEEIEYN